MQHTDDDMTRYLKTIVFAVICLLALSGTGRKSGNTSIQEIKFTSDVHQTDVRAVLAAGISIFAILLPVDIPQSIRTVNEKNKILEESSNYEISSFLVFSHNSP
jgi:aspartate-semialdehyde dehydrogenase